MTWQRGVRRLLHESYWKLFQRRFYASWRQQRQIRTLPLPEIRQLQWIRLKQVLQHAFDHTDFYHQYFASVKLTPDDIRRPEDLLKLPVTDKQTYRTHFQQILPRQVREADLVPCCTSGSSGEPFRFYLDAVTEAAHTSAAFALNKEAMGIVPWDRVNELALKVEPKNKIEITTGAKAHRGGHLSCKRILASQHVGVSIKDLTPANIGAIAQIIESRNLHAIYGYSSSIFSLARYLSAHHRVPRMQYAITIGEGLLKQQRDYISAVFGCPVYRDYSASECMRMGFECRCQSGYHMDIYNYYFEYLDGTGYARDDDAGDMVVTNLNNYVFPFIRYRIGDRGEPCHGTCRCGLSLPLMRTLHGRPSDIVTTPAGKDIPAELFTVFFEYLDQYVRQFQVVQSMRDALEIRIVPTEKMSDRVKEHVEKEIGNFVERSMAVTVVCVDEIEMEATGKRRIMVPLPRP